MDKFRVLPLSQFNELEEEIKQVRQTEEVTEKIEKLPKSTQRKLKRFISLLGEHGIVIENSANGGISEGMYRNILYCIQGKSKSEDTDTFLHQLKDVRFPNGLLSTKVSRELTKLKRRSKSK